MKKDGGAAFPLPAVMPTVRQNGAQVWHTPFQEAQTGMSLRDYFMVHAPAQEIADLVPADIKGCASYIGIPAEDYKGNQHYLLVLSKARGEWADAMLAERDK